MKSANAAKGKLACVLGLVFFAMLIPASGGTQNEKQAAVSSPAQTSGKVVYVCACLKNRSCSCMTEAKMEGPCACGTEG
jgi:hypothetical protein